MDIFQPSAAHDSGDDSALIERATGLSRYLRHLVANDPGMRPALMQELRRPYRLETMEQALAATTITDEPALRAALRRLRKQVMARVIARDLNGLADLDEVVATVSDLAEVSLGCAQAHLHAWLTEIHGSPIGIDSQTPQQLLLVAMGKLGGRELNVSSDIDLVFVYPEEGETRGPRSISNHEYFAVLGRKLVAAMSEMTEDGFVFRVDMRLRPYGDSGALAVSFDMLEDYFITQGREWERYAWIKSRALGPGRVAELEQLVRPFVFRKYLDFGAFDSLRALHAQIKNEVQRRDLRENIKLGPGGIREIEFIAQAFQLVRGGREPELRVRATRSCLRNLARAGHLPPEAAAELSEAYMFLRNLEHRLQYLDDRQTQTLPASADDRRILATAMGFGSREQLLQELELRRGKVTRHFEQVFATAPGGPDELGALALNPESEEAAAQIARFGFADPQYVQQQLAQIHRGNRYRQLPAASQSRFDSLLPELLRAAARAPAPEQTLERMLRLLQSVSRRGAYLALLVEYPQALEGLARLASSSQWACEYLERHPILMDELLDARALYRAPEWPQLDSELGAQLGHARGDGERQMDILRHFRHAQTFRLLAQDLAQLLPLEILSDHLSALADLVLGKTLALCWEYMRVKHRESPRFAIIGYGKLGGRELGYASDLDIIFLYRDEADAAHETYARLAQHINAWLTRVTPAGVLFETDLRLRPDGAGGLLVSSLEAFTAYQKNHAWVWEHQALTRARYCAGDPEVGQAMERVREEVLRIQRDVKSVRGEVLAMREKMRNAHKMRAARRNSGGLFDVKHDPGGIVDVEFIVQFLVLAHAHAHPELVPNIGNLALLKRAGEIGLIPAERASRAQASYREYRRLQHKSRLAGEKSACVEAASLSPQITAVTDLWKFVFDAGG